MITPQAKLASDEDETVVPILEETVRLHKRQVATGKVSVRTVVDSIEEVASADLKSETAEVTRVSIDKIVDEAPGVRTEDGVVIIPVVEEVMVVEKRLLLKEELHIRRVMETEAVEVPVTLRKQRAIIEHQQGSDEEDRP